MGPAAVHSAEAAAPVGIPTRIEGPLKSISDSTWFVDQTKVVLDAKTTLNEQRGSAVVTAWVAVFGQQYEDHLAAEYIQVMRPAGAPAPIYQFTGSLRKMVAPLWVVDDTLVRIDPETKITGTPEVNALVQVTARRDNLDLVASQVEVLALSPDVVPVAIEGIVQQVTSTSWMVDGKTILIGTLFDTQVNQGDRVEVKALVAKDGSLVAQHVSVVDPSLETQLSGYVTAVAGLGEDNQTWSVLVFEGGRGQNRTVHVSADTYVDEDRATVEPEVEALVEGENAGTGSVAAAIIRLEQPVSVTAAGALVAGEGDSLSTIGGQPAWFAADSLRDEALAHQAAVGAQRAMAASVPVAVRGIRLSSGVIIVKQVLTGAEAASAAAVTGQEPNAGTYASDWYGPSEIVPRVQNATRPTLLFSPDGSGHAIYASEGTIYYATQPSGGAWSPPRRIGSGSTPSAVFDAQGRLHVAYVSQFLENYDILHLRLDHGRWSLPVVVRSTGRSADPTLAADAMGKVYLAWMDTTSGAWAIQTGTWDGGYWTTYPVSNARGQSPALTILADGSVFLAWQDRVPTALNTWGNYDIYASERKDKFWSLPVNVSDNAAFAPTSDSLGPRLASSGDGLAHIAWIDNNAQVRYASGRGLYWPVPVDVTGVRPLARGLAMRLAADGLLYLTWDEGGDVRLTASPPMTQVWPAAHIIAPETTLAGEAPAGTKISDVSLTAAAGGVAVSWVQEVTPGVTGIYESRHNMARVMLKSCYLPLTITP